ncbi:MAG: hypothetical protein AAGA56_26570 [Myxococcota bacterium]
MSVAAGASATWTVTFPHAIKFERVPAGIVLAKTELKKSDGTFVDDKTFSYKVGVKGVKKGTHTVKGKMKLSVCNDKECVRKKVDVVAKISVK